MPHEVPNNATSDSSVKVAWISFAGTLGAAFIAGAFSLVVAGGKANEASGRPTNLIANVQAGLTLVNPARPASDSFPAPVAQAAAANEATAPHAMPKPPAPSTAIQAGTCSGLDRKWWSVQIAPVTPLHGKDDANRELTGYNINLQLTNVADRSFAVNYNQSDLTDDQGNLLKLSSSSLQPNNPNFPPTAVSPGADLPANLRFLGTGTVGKTVSFTLNLHVFTQDDKPRIERVETLACTTLPVT